MTPCIRVWLNFFIFYFLLPLFLLLFYLSFWSSYWFTHFWKVFFLSVNLFRLFVYLFVLCVSVIPNFRFPSLFVFSFFFLVYIMPLLMIIHSLSRSLFMYRFFYKFPFILLIPCVWVRFFFLDASFLKFLFYCLLSFTYFNELLYSLGLFGILFFIVFFNFHYYYYYFLPALLYSSYLSFVFLSLDCIFVDVFFYSLCIFCIL